DFSASHYSTNGHASTHGFGDNHYIRCNAVMLNREHRSCAAEPRLNFIRNQQNSMLLKDCLESAQEAWRGNHKTALALHRFNDNRSNLIWGNFSYKHPLKFLQTELGSLLWAHIHAVWIGKWRSVDFWR